MVSLLVPWLLLLLLPGAACCCLLLPGAVRDVNDVCVAAGAVAGAASAGSVRGVVAAGDVRRW